MTAVAVLIAFPAIAVAVIAILALIVARQAVLDEKEDGDHQ